MGLTKLTDRIYYYPHQPEFDRPMLAYLNGDKLSLVIDAGYSASHVHDFYAQLECADLKAPALTMITHWHYDHTFGMKHIRGLSAALDRTNAHLKRQREQAADPQYIAQLKQEDPHFEKEYAAQPDPVIVLSDIAFHDGITCDLGGLTAVAFHTEAPHSDDTVCVYVPEEKVLFLGDSTSEDFFDHSRMDLSKLAHLTRMIEHTDCVYCMLSHAEPLKKDELLAYLYSILEG